MSAERNRRSEGKGRLRWLNPLASGAGGMGRLARLVALLAVVYLLASPFVMFYEYQRAFPPPFDPVPQPSQGQKAPPAGSAYTDALLSLVRDMQVAWLPNDVVYPSVFLDNPQNFQLGELEVVRYATRVLRDKLSRQRTTDKIDPHADKAFTAFANNPHLWLWPSFESKLSAGAKALAAYRQGLRQDTSHFYPRADNLIELLDQLTSLLGGENTRLANAPPDRAERLSEETAGDQFLSGERRRVVQVPWLEVDNNFYHARGVAYALRQVLLAVKWEFREILEVKRSGELMDTVIEDLALADFEPLLVLNGSRDSVFANHSLMLMATLEDVRQKLINLQQMLER